jgi:hypothetical protein
VGALQRADVGAPGVEEVDDRYLAEEGRAGDRPAGARSMSEKSGTVPYAGRERRENSLLHKITPDPRHRRGALSIAPLRSFSWRAAGERGNATAQIGALDRLAPEQVGGRAFEDDLPGFQHVAAVGNL